MRMMFRNTQRNKYGNNKIVWDGETFDSQAEFGRYRELLWLQRHGDITELRRQVRFELVPSGKDDHGKVIERPVYYIADFVYIDKDDQLVVEDVKGGRGKEKGTRTPEYVIKRKLMLWRHGIRIREIIR